MNPSQFHVPVLVHEVVEYLVRNKSGIYIDCTLGGGGHSLAILKTLKSTGKIIGFDVDDDALNFSKNKLSSFKNKIEFKQANFSRLAEELNNDGISEVDGVLLDLGVSSHQIDVGVRGFSYTTDGPLDMRMNKYDKITAECVINEFELEQLIDLFRTYGEEKLSKIIAKTIIKERKSRRIASSQQLVGIISKVIPYKNRVKTYSRIFQALRIFVNEELKNLNDVLNQSIPLLRRGGRLVVISYHSLEDRIVKNFYREHANPCTCPPNLPQCVCGKTPSLKLLTKRAIRPSALEIENNIRSRSARLRVAERI